MDQLTCTDATTRYAYARLLNAQIATEVAKQTSNLHYMAHAISGMRIVAANAAFHCRMSSRSRTAHYPTTHAERF